MGKPERLDRSSRAEYIGAWRPTRGSETSQYPEEKKSNETPQVAASERGPGQTNEACLVGVVGPYMGPMRIAETHWKVLRHRVIGPYAKSKSALGIS